MKRPLFPVLLLSLFAFSCDVAPDAPSATTPQPKVQPSMQLFSAFLDPLPDTLAISVDETTLIGEQMIHLLQRLKHTKSVYHLEESIGEKLLAADGMLGGGDYRHRPAVQYTTRMGLKGKPFTEAVTVGARILSIDVALRYPQKGEGRETLVEATFPTTKKPMSMNSMGFPAKIGDRPAKGFLAIIRLKLFVRKPDGTFLETSQQVSGTVYVPDSAPVAYVVEGV